MNKYVHVDGADFSCHLCSFCSKMYSVEKMREVICELQQKKQFLKCYHCYVSEKSINQLRNEK